MVPARHKNGHTFQINLSLSKVEVGTAVHFMCAREFFHALGLHSCCTNLLSRAFENIEHRTGFRATFSDRSVFLLSHLVPLSPLCRAVINPVTTPEEATITVTPGGLIRNVTKPCEGTR